MRLISGSGLGALPEIKPGDPVTFGLAGAAWDTHHGQMPDDVDRPIARACCFV
jgi:hypothetical protein